MTRADRQYDTHFSRTAGILVGIVLILCGIPSGAQNSTNALLRTAAEVRRLSPEEAARQLPVHLRAVVTFHDGALYSRFVQDETAGIYLEATTNMPPFGAGQLVELTGRTGPGEYAPIVMLDSIRVVGEAPMPAAKPVTIEELVSGREDSQFIQVEATVRAVKFEEETQYFLLDLAMGGERFSAYTPELPHTNTAALVESVVQVRGVCSTLFNRQRQLFGFRLLVPRKSDLEIVTPAAADPFNIPISQISSLLRFASQGTFGPRVKVRGTVTYYEPGAALFIQNQNEGLYCQTRQRDGLRPGDEVEVLGFPAKGEYTPVLQDAIYRKMGQSAVPEPAGITIDEALAGTHDCRLVRITGKLLEHTRRGREQFIILENRGFVFPAYLGGEETGPGFPAAEPGSEVEVRGICLIERGSSWRAGEGWRAKGFRLLLRSPQDLAVLRSPPWLDVQRALWITGALGIIALAASGWVTVLRRQVADRTRELEAEIHQRQLAEKRREIEQERARVAHDLHDDLGAGLTEVNMLTTLALSPMTSDQEKQRYLSELSGTAERMVTSLDEIVWAVNPRNDTIASLASYLGSYAERLLDLASVRCGLDVAEDLPDYPLDPKFRQEIFLASKEALTNVVRHARATHVWLRISVQDRKLTVEISDDGQGFDPRTDQCGADGLLNMRHRLESLGGTCEITRATPQGTSVKLTAPLPERLL